MKTTTVAHVEATPAASRVAPPGLRTLLGYGALALPAAAIVLDTALALARGWEFESRLDRAGVIASVAWCLGLTVLLLAPFGRRWFERYFAQLLVLSISFCATWLATDLAVGSRLLNVVEPIHGQRPGATFSFRPQPGVMRDVGPEGRMTFNRWGVRGSDAPLRGEAYRVLCLGGSTTGCTYLDDAKTWPSVLESELNAANSARRVWVGNIGWPGYRTSEHRQFVEQSPLMGQIDCLVVQCGINDFMACLLGPRPAPPMWTHSRIWRMLAALVRPLTARANTIEDAAGTVYTRRRAARHAATIDDRTPQLDDCLARFADNVAAIVEQCRRHGVRVVFTSQPVLWRADLDADNLALLWFGELSDGRYLSVAQLRAGIDRYNERLRSFCQQHDVEWIDLSSLDGDPAVFYDDCHFTETGARRVAELLANWFVEHPIDAGQDAAR